MLGDAFAICVICDICGFFFPIEANPLDPLPYEGRGNADGLIDAEMSLTGLAQSRI
jgi:hypothetical protein